MVVLFVVSNYSASLVQMSRISVSCFGMTLFANFVFFIPLLPSLASYQIIKMHCEITKVYTAIKNLWLAVKDFWKASSRICVICTFTSFTSP